MIKPKIINSFYHSIELNDSQIVWQQRCWLPWSADWPKVECPSHWCCKARLLHHLSQMVVEIEDMHPACLDHRLHLWSTAYQLGWKAVKSNIQVLNTVTHPIMTIILRQEPLVLHTLLAKLYLENTLLAECGHSFCREAFKKRNS